MIGRSSIPNVFTSNLPSVGPSSVERERPTGNFHDSGARIRGRMCAPTYWKPPDVGCAVKRYTPTSKMSEKPCVISRVSWRAWFVPSTPPGVRRLPDPVQLEWSSKSVVLGSAVFDG
jgi:hypothetical protein